MARPPDTRRLTRMARVPQLPQYLREERFLAGEMVVDGPLRDVCARGDAVHAGRVEAGREKFLIAAETTATRLRSVRR